MSPDELKQVVAKIQLGDSRQVDPLVLREWHELIGHLDMDDCLRAVTMHRQESTEYLQPAHVIANVRRLRKPRELHARPDELFCPVHYGMPPRGCERCREDIEVGNNVDFGTVGRGA